MKNIVFLLVGICLLVSCSKTKTTTSTTPTPPTSTGSPVSGIVSYMNLHCEIDGLNPEEITDSIFYATSGLMNRTSRPNEKTLKDFTYNGSNIVRTNYYLNSVLIGKDTLYYSGSQLDSSKYIPSDTTVKGQTIRRSYASGKITKLVYVNPDNTTPNKKNYTFDVSGNLKSIEITDGNGNFQNSYEYYYGSTVNKLSTTAMKSFYETLPVNSYLAGFVYSASLPDSIVYKEGTKTQGFKMSYNVSTNDYVVDVISNGKKWITFGY